MNNDLVSGRFPALLVAIARVGTAFLWIQNVGWKDPSNNFGLGTTGGLFDWVNHAITYPVFLPYTWFVQGVVLPGFIFFGWLTLLMEAAIGALLLAGFATRAIAILGFIQTGAITLSVLNSPNEWHWSYYLMFISSIFIFAIAAGRYYGVDGVLRPAWKRADTKLGKLLVVAS